MDWALGAMHEPPPEVDWRDVAFDWAAARDAATACDRLATILREVAGWHSRSTDRLLETWQGGLAEAYDDRGWILRARLQAAESRLVAQAASLRRAAEEALDEQRARERQRDDWWDWDARRRRQQRLSG